MLHTFHIPRHSIHVVRMYLFGARKMRNAVFDECSEWEIVLHIIHKSHNNEST